MKTLAFTLLLTALTTACSGGDKVPLTDAGGQMVRDQGPMDSGQPDAVTRDATRRDSVVTDASRLDANSDQDSRPPVRDAAVSPDARLDATTPAVDAAPARSDAAPIRDMMGMGDECPDRQGRADCLFGGFSRALLESETLHVVESVRHRNVNTMSPLERRQFVHGFLCDGIFMPMTAEAAFADVDEFGVQMYRIRRVNPEGWYTWFRFYMGDTEVGYIFVENTLELVAIVSDQDIIACQEPVGNNPPMTCAQLDQCLQACNEVDLACRRPCLRATDPDAIENYITWGECRADCGADQGCLDRVCGDERAACFGP